MTNEKIKSIMAGLEALNVQVSLTVAKLQKEVAALQQSEAPQPKPVPKGKKICIEIGHGPWKDGAGNSGFEEGAVGVGTTEYKENVARADYIKELLQDIGHTVVLVDASDTLSGLGSRAAGSDVFVSLHLNAFNRQAQGTETLVHTKGTDEDVKLARAIQKRCLELLKLTDRGVKRQGLGVLLGVPGSVRAACLSEAFFIDALSSAAEIRAMSKLSAEAIAAGIIDYCQTF